MESRLSWHRAVESSREFDTWVLCHAPLSLPATDPQAPANRPWSPRPGLWLVPLEPTRAERWLFHTPGLFYSAYHQFHRQAFRTIQALHREWNFDLVHQVGFCGYREPGYGWKLEVPFVWGPVGGTQNMPLRFLTEMGWRGAALELMRNGLNMVHFRYRRRVRAAFQKASHLWTANSLSASHFQQIHGVRSEVQLETGIEQLPAEPTRQRATNQPLRILWSGRFEHWKGLPLLFRALAAMPSDFRYELRIVGKGQLQSAWQQLANRIGIGPHVRWEGWPTYRQSWAHYAWADLFVFTSLRDTSGTGLLEALAHGCPVVGLDHQGARDIVTAESGWKIPVRSPKQVVLDLRQALIHLAQNGAELARLQQGARQRSEDFLWAKLGERMRATYRQVLAGTAVPSHSSSAREFSVAESHS